MSQVVIKGGKLLKDGKKGQTVEITFTEQVSSDSKISTVNKEDFNEPRQQLRDALASLAIHGAIRCEFIPSAIIQDIENYNPDLVKDYRVTGFSKQGSEEDPMVKIYVTRTLKSGEAMSFNTPNIRLEDENYLFSDHLQECIKNCEDEFLKYINGEYGVASGEMDFKGKKSE